MVARMRKLARGAQVTLLGKRNPVWLRVITATDVGLDEPAFFARRFSGGSETGHVLRYTDEGVRWIRGHHTRDSEAVRALRAVAAVLRA